MSYSFNVQARTKAEAHQKIAAEFDAVLDSQPVHEADLPAARVAAAAFVDVLKEPTEKEAIKVRVNGYVTWRAEGEFVGASFGVTADLGPRDDG
jgi:hypothetical protein